MMRFLVVLVFVAFAGFPARADEPDEPLDEIRALLDAGDVAGLEQEMARLNDLASAGQGAHAIRAVNTRLFETTHPDRRAVIHRWAEEMPASPYAATAEAWVGMKELEMWSGPSQRYQMGQGSALFDSFTAARDAARTTLGRAVELSDGTYVSALDAWMRAREFAANWNAFGSVADGLLALAPDAETARIIVRAGVSQSSSEAQQAVGFCLELGEVIEDYDADACMIEASADQYLGEEVRDMVFDLVEESEDPRFASVRLEALLDFDRVDPAKADTWVELHRKTLGPDTDLADYAWQAWTIMRKGDLPGYNDEVMPRIIAELDARLADDPLNHKLLRLKADLLHGRFMKNGNDADLAAARAAWEGLSVYAEPVAETWTLGGQLAQADRDPSDIEAAQVFWENAIAYSRQDVSNILTYFYVMNLARDAAEARLAAGDLSKPDPAAVLEALKCPMLRAARTSAALCQTPGAGGEVCDPSRPYFKPVPAVLEEGKAGSCPEVAAASLSALAYKATPFSEIGDPWPRASE